MEIERKFLLGETPDLTNTAYTEISQGYLSYEPEIRIRKDASKFYITKKSEGNLTREEEEIEITSELYNILSDLIDGREIKKTRYYVSIDKYIAEVNFYHEELEGFSMIEVEFPNEEEANSFSIPNWFGEEVTHLEEYKNKNLARYGLQNIKTK